MCMLIKPSVMDGALYGIPLTWIHNYKIKATPNMNIFTMNELHLEVFKSIE